MRPRRDDDDDDVEDEAEPHVGLRIGFGAQRSAGEAEVSVSGEDDERDVPRSDRSAGSPAVW